MKRRFLKITAVYLVISILAEIVYPTAAYALTGGPSQPEVQSFEPVGTSEMVDVFSGDFVYNIPLLDVEGYPVNLSYHGGVSMDQEASWTGLGWNINPGVINRNMRGIPDDFDGSKGDKITNTYNTKPNRTYGVKGSLGFELLGKEGELPLRFKKADKEDAKKDGIGGLNFGLGIQYNNYKGFAIEQSVSATIAVGQTSKGTYTGGLGLTSSSDDGLSISPSISFETKQKTETDGDRDITSSNSRGISTSFNSRAGLKAVSLDFNTHRSISNNKTGEIKDGGKKKSVTLPSNGGSAITFGLNTYTPPVMLPMSSASVTFSGKGGGTFFGLDGTYNLTGYYSEQKLQYNSESVPAYGYFNSEKAKSSRHAMHDFNREKEGGFSKNTPALPLTNYTYDVYSVSGQGIGGMYRPYRSEIGHVYDRSLSNTSFSFSLGLELGTGNVAKVGADPKIVDVYTHSGMWSRGNDAIRKLGFSKGPGNVAGYETFFFKEAGEKSVDAEYEDELDPAKSSFFEKSGKYHPVRLDLIEKGGLEVGVASRFKNEEGTVENISSPIYRNKRQKRNQAIYYLTVSEAKRFAIDPAPFNSTEENKKISSQAKDHHIGEITALRPDGARYIYGIPAYNTHQEEVTFAVGDGVSRDRHIADNATGLVTYETKDNGLENKRGIDNYFQKTEIPPFAHSYLLTSVLSSDYVDNDDIVGPSANDMGNYTKFNYSKTKANYNWRVPVGTKKANSNEGLLSITNDDKANYLYGTKEIWYVESIETKNFIAVFELGSRADGLGVENKDGALLGDMDQGMRLLKTIKLFVRADYKKDPVNAVPLKTVHFDYDYSLCPGIDNNILKSNATQIKDANGFTNQGGKLTLKRLYFTYQNSNKGRFSPYEFGYSAFNPSYSPKAYDRWGNYKDSKGDFRNNIYNPYSEQDLTVANKNANAWTLNRVDLPSGGSIDVTYQSDDYAYVQDRQAMQMFKIVGISEGNEELGSNKLYKEGSWLSSSGHNYALHIPVAPGTDDATFKEKYLKGIKQLYFRFCVNMSKDVDDNWEMVSGYATIASSKVINNTGIIVLQSTGLGEKAHKGLQVNPVTRAALQYSRLYTPKHAYNQPDATDGELSQVFKSILNSTFAKNIKSMAMGINGDLLSKGHCSEVDLSRSFIRLLSPDKKKFGGGARVKTVTINDNSASFKMGSSNSHYGQTYNYETEDPDNPGVMISSGVASYEPMLGGEENPFREPVLFGTKFQEKLLIPDDRYYLERPFGEAFFPAPSVGYSKVTVSSYKPENVELQRHGTGKIVHEFYTAKDYPVITEYTDLQVIPKKSNLALRLLKISQKDFLHASQGFVVELNDMHGKPKAQWTYAEGQASPISGIEYKYKDEGKRLVNEAVVIDRKGKVRTATIGVDFDMIADTREQETETYSVGLNGNLAVFLAAILPASVPLILPAYSKDQNRFRSAVVTKVINRYGLLEETIAHDLGSIVSTKNLAFDGETGELLLNEVKNNYDDPVYSFNYPAHWAYDRMGQAYRNIGLVFELDFEQGDASLEQGDLTAPISQELFVEGDELVILYNEYQAKTLDPVLTEEIKHRYWIVRKEENRIFVMGGSRSTGCKYPLTGKTIFKIVRSGRRNQQNIPIGSVTSKVNPIRMDETGQLLLDLKVLDYQVLGSSASEYSDDWGIFCSCGIGPGDFYNPYYRGTKGRWRGEKGYTYLTDRKQTHPQAKLREDGPFTSFSPFWNSPVSGVTWIKNTTDPNWKWVTEISRYDPYSGSEIENKDALGRYSGALNGYNHSLPVSVAPNSKYSEIFYDNFEDYDLNSCNEDLSKFNNGSTGNLDSKAHSGRKSIKVSKTGSAVNLSIAPACP